MEFLELGSGGGGDAGGDGAGDAALAAFAARAVAGRKRRRPEDDGHHGDARKRSRGPGGDSGGGGRRARRDGRADAAPPPPPAPEPDLAKFSRGAGNTGLKALPDVKLAGKLRRREAEARRAAKAAADAELLLTEEAGYLEAEGMEATYRFKQADIAAASAISVAKKAVELTLDTYGPYHLRYSRSGRHMVLGGEKGHIAIIDWATSKPTLEFHVHETVHDVAFLHDSTMFAVAQKKYAYIYDRTGAELHVLKQHIQPLALEFLPHHFLLASIGNAGYLKYQDVSTGALVAEHHTTDGRLTALRANPWNAVLCCGTASGAVTMWTPNMSTPIVKMATHTGPVNAVAIDSGGRYMVTAGMDARVKVWDIRRFADEAVHSYFVPVPAHGLDISQRGMVAVGYGAHLQVWGRDFGLEAAATAGGDGGLGLVHPLPPPTMPTATAAARALARTAAAGGAGGKPGHHLRFDDDDGSDGEGEEEEEEADGLVVEVGSGAAAGGKPGYVRRVPLPAGVVKAKAPYMRHELPGRLVVDVRFRPYDDVLAVGHTRGVTTLLVPGAGEPNYDSRAADPFRGKKDASEAEVAALLDKLQPSTIALDPTVIGTVDRTDAVIRKYEDKVAEEHRAAKAAMKRGKDPRTNRGERKHKARITTKVVTQKDALRARNAAAKAEERERAAERGGDGKGSGAAAGGAGAPASALARFY